MIEIGLVFVTGVLASLHCVGMCGPIVLAYATLDAPSRSIKNRAMFTWHAAYNGGRIMAYATLGAIVGLAGTAINSIKNISEYISITGGLLMVLFGLAMLGILLHPIGSGSKN